MAKSNKGELTRDEVMAAINDRWGKGSVMKGSEAPMLLRLPSGSYGLDFIMGGGYPVGRMIRKYGGEASGKTMMAMKAIRNAQNYGAVLDSTMPQMIEWADDHNNKRLSELYKRQWEEATKRFPDGKMRCAYFNVEDQFDEDQIKLHHGVNTDELELVNGNVIEEIGGKAESMMPVIDLFVIDSASAAISLAELNMEVEEQRRGVGPKQWGLMLKRIHNRMQPNNTGIIIDHARIDMKTGKEYAPGGMHMAHDQSMTLHYQKGTWLFLDKNGELTDNSDKRAQPTLTGDIEADGLELVVRNVKSRVSKPLRKHRMRLDFNEQRIDLEYEIINAGIFLNLIEKSGSWYYILDNEGERITKGIQGTANLSTYLKENQDQKHRILTAWRNHSV